MTIFHRHKWSDWAITDRGKVMHHREYVGAYLTQNRHCHSCGKTETDDQANYGGWDKFFCHRVSETQPVRRKDGVSA